MTTVVSRHGSNVLAMTDAEITKRYESELSIDDAQRELARLRKIVERAGFLLEQRIPTTGIKCHVCKKPIDNERTVRMMTTRLDPETGLRHPVALCSTACVNEWTKERMGLKGAVGISGEIK